MNNMKRLIYVVMLVSMLFSIAGCTAKQETEVGQEVNPKQEEGAEKQQDSAEKTASELSYQIVGTGQTKTYDKDGNIIDPPKEGEPCYGQDAQYESLEPSFTDNGDGTITDNNTGLIWQKTPPEGVFSWDEAGPYCENLELAGRDDWRLPTAKELFSLIDFEPDENQPVLDTEYFDFPPVTEVPEGLGSGPQGGAPQGGPPDESKGPNEGADNDMPPPPPPQDEAAGGIQKQQGQFWSSNFYLAGLTHGGAETAFGVNHVTGHIKGYPAGEPGGMMGKRVRAVTGSIYGENEFVDNGDGTISDLATGLMWMKDDYGEGIEWEEALEYCENLEFAGYDDWKLPNVKELQSIVDYSGVYPAVNPTYFNCTKPEDEDYFTWLWSSTSADETVGAAWYVSFGKAVGLDGQDSHGAGAVRDRQKYEASQYTEEGDTYVCTLRAVRVID
jgi:predicted small lipoprotein YifL